MEWKVFKYYNREYKLSEYGDLIRCAFIDHRVSSYYKNEKLISYEADKHYKEKKIIPNLDSDGYLQTSLYCKPYSRHITIHALVYSVFIKGLDVITNIRLTNYSHENRLFNQINHIDGNKLNNHYKNLELVSLQENIAEAVKLGSHNSQTKSMDVEIYYKGSYIATIWKTRQASDFIFDYFKIKVGIDVISRCVKYNKEYKDFSFRYKPHNFKKGATTIESLSNK